MSLPPDPTCIECDTELVDLDMAEDFDDPSIRWGVGRCPNPECSKHQPTYADDVARAVSAATSRSLTDMVAVHWDAYRIPIATHLLRDFNPLWRAWEVDDRPLIRWSFDPFPRWTRLCTRVRHAIDDRRQRFAQWVWPHECNCSDEW